MGEIADLTDICRLCLNTPIILIPFETTTFTSNQTIPEIIKFCLDIHCSTRDDNIFPKNVCETCLGKLEVCWELKKIAHESDKYLKQILLNSHSDDVDDQTITPYDPAPYPHQSQEDDLLDEIQPLGEYYCESNGYNAADSYNLNDLNLEKGQRCGEFTCSVCAKNFKYLKSFRNHLKTHKSFGIRDDESNEEQTQKPEEEEVSDTEAPDDPEYTKNGERSADHICPVCGQPFKYMKPYKNHLKLHKSANVTNGKTHPLNRQHAKRKRISTGPSYSQAPYDSISPYESSATIISSPARESSPDMGMMMVGSNFLNDSSGLSAKRARTRKQKLPSRSPSQEPSPELIEYKPRSRGRPKKIRDVLDESNLNAGMSQRSAFHLHETNSGEAEIEPARSRGRPKKIRDTHDESNSSAGMSQRSEFHLHETNSGETEIKPARSRGRPKKIRDTHDESNSSARMSQRSEFHLHETNSGETEIKPARSRGRPKKIRDAHDESNSNAGMSQRSAFHLHETNSEIDSEIEPARSRGRPMKAQDSEDINPELARFSEVDVSKLMLKSKPLSILADDSLVAASSENSFANRSRSPSVEVVQEFDIFGSSTMSHDVLSTAPSSSNFACDVQGCNKKFHLKANLKKHQRERH